MSKYTYTSTVIQTTEATCDGCKVMRPSLATEAVGMDLFRKTPCVSVMDDQRGAWLVGRGCIDESGAQVQTAEVKCQTATGGGNGYFDLA